MVWCVWSEATGRGSSPCLQALQGVVDIALVELHHVAVHLWVVVPDVPLCAAVRDRPEAERRGEVVGPLELRRGRGGDAVTVRSKRRGGGRWGGEEEEEEEERKQ